MSAGWKSYLNLTKIPHAHGGKSTWVEGSVWFRVFRESSQAWGRSWAEKESTLPGCAVGMQRSPNPGTQQGWTFPLWIIMSLKSIKRGLCNSGREGAMWGCALLGRRCFLRLKKILDFHLTRCETWMETPKCGGEALCPCQAEQALPISLSTWNNIEICNWVQTKRGHSPRSVWVVLQRRQINTKNSSHKGRTSQFVYKWADPLANPLPF